jgi:hypothetical protein
VIPHYGDRIRLSVDDLAALPKDYVFEIESALGSRSPAAPASERTFSHAGLARRPIYLLLICLPPSKPDIDCGRSL